MQKQREQEAKQRDSASDRSLQDDAGIIALAQESCLDVPGFLIHNCIRPLVHAKGQRRSRVCQQVDPEDLDRGQRRGQTGKDRRCHQHDFSEVGTQEIDYRLADVVEEISSLHDRVLDGDKVVIHQDHLSRILRDFRSADTHGDTDIRCLQGRRVVHAVSCHGYDLVMALECLYDLYFIFRRYPGKDSVVEDFLPEYLRIHLVDLLTGDALFQTVGDIQLSGDGKGSDLVVARDHRDIDPGMVALIYRLFHAFFRRVDLCSKADKDHVFFLRLLIPFSVGKSEHAQCPGAHILRSLCSLIDVFIGDRTHTLRGEDPVTAHDHGIDRAFGIRDVDLLSSLI